MAADGEADKQTVTEMADRIKEDPSDVAALLKQCEAYFRLDDFRASRATASQGTAACEALLKKFRMWERKCDTHITEEDGAAKKQHEQAQGATVADATAADAAEAKAAAEPAAEGATAPAKIPDVRRDWFQTADSVTLCFYIKMGQQIKGSTDHATVAIAPRSLDVRIKMKTGEDYTFSASPLAGAIIAERSTYSTKQMKVEVILAKAAHGEHWDKLEGARQYADKVSAYPTSHKKQVDWTKEAVVDDEEAKPEGNDALNHLFQDIYSKADEATKRAMNKSFVESNGTVLSTNWSEVGSKKVEGQPPAGMEEKKWGA